MHTFAQVGEGDDITRVIGRPSFVGHPHLQSGNLHASHDMRQRLHRLIIFLTKVMSEEEVTVLFIVGGIYLKRCCLCATTR